MLHQRRRPPEQNRRPVLVEEVEPLQLRSGAPDLVVVLGVHRSGTSALARALRVAGVELGERLMPPNAKENAKGYWEDLDIYELNVEMLQFLGREWHSLQPVTAQDVQSLCGSGFLPRASALLRAKRNGARTFGFKDPRVSKLLPFWLEVFAHDGLEVAYALSLRNPLSVARSLSQRNGFPARKSHLLWLDHVFTALHHIADRRHAVVDFDSLVARPGTVIEKASSLLGLQLDPAALKEYESDFLDESLRHAQFTPGDLDADADCPSVVKAMYLHLRAIAEGRARVAADELAGPLRQWRGAVDAMAPSLVLADELWSELERSRVAVHEAGGRERELGAALQTRESEAAALQDELERRRAELARQAAMVLELEARTREARQELAQACDRLSSASELASQRERLISSLETRLQDASEHHGAEVARRGAELDALRAELEAVREEGDRHRADMARQAAALREQETRHGETEQELAATSARLSAAAEVATQRERLIASLEARLRDAGSLREQEASRHAADLASLGAELERLRAESTRQAAAAAEQEMRSRRTEEEAALLRQQLAAHLEAAAAREHLVTGLERELRETRSLLQQSQASAAGLQRALEASRGDVSRTQDALDSARIALGDLQSARLQERTAASKVESDLEQTRRDLQRAREAQAAASELAATRDAAIGALRARLAEHRDAEQDLMAALLTRDRALAHVEQTWAWRLVPRLRADVRAMLRP